MTFFICWGNNPWTTALFYYKIQGMSNHISNQCISDRNSLIFCEHSLHLSWLKEQERLGAGIVVTMGHGWVCDSVAPFLYWVFVHICIQHIFLLKASEKKTSCMFFKSSFLYWRFQIAFNTERLQLYFYHRWREREEGKKHSPLSLHYLNAELSGLLMSPTDREAAGECNKELLTIKSCSDLPAAHPRIVILHLFRLNCELLHFKEASKAS